MSKSIYRWQDEIKPIELMSKSSKLINMNTVRRDPRFSNKKGYVATTFKKDTYLYNVGEIPYTYDKEFTVCFWAKFEKLKDVYGVHPNNIHIIFNDGTSIGATLPKTIGTDNKELVQTDWNWYKIQRDTNNTVTIYVNNEQIATGTNTTVFNLNDKSYIYLGNDSKTLTGYDVTVDDVLIFGGVNEYLKDIPTDYLELSKFYKMVYIKSSDNSVWAMRHIATSGEDGRTVINLCSGAYNYPKEFYKNMESNVTIDTTDPTQFYLTPVQYRYTTGPLKEFTLEMVICDAPQDGRIYLQDNMSYSLLEIISDYNGVSVYYKYDKLFNIHHEEYLCITYDGNNLFGYRSENLKKENMTQMTLKSMQILPYEILFWFTGKNDIPFRLFRVSNKFNDIYYAK